jgi:archaeosine-15-forming tRNA-guanine transglycosylase
LTRAALLMVADDARKAEPQPVDVWIDHENRVRRVTVRDELEENTGIITTFEFFDFGVDVDVQVPPADKLITQERLDELQGHGSARMTDAELEALCREAVPKDEADEVCTETEANE